MDGQSNVGVSDNKEHPPPSYDWSTQPGNQPPMAGQTMYPPVQSGFQQNNWPQQPGAGPPPPPGMNYATPMGGSYTTQYTPGQGGNVTMAVVTQPAMGGRPAGFPRQRRNPIVICFVVVCIIITVMSIIIPLIVNLSVFSRN